MEPDAPAPGAGRRAPLPTATYRLQLRPEFGFEAAARTAPYLASLGVSDAYLSPVFAARPGSTHGYDICDHGRLNPEIGGEAGFSTLEDALRHHGLGALVDVVPNHMGIDPRTNRWWRDVLENGPSSPFADFFDVDWDPVKPELRDRVLLPILGDQYGAVLERGELRVELADGALELHYFDHCLPLNPRQAPLVLDPDGLRASLGDDHPHLLEFLSILTALRNLPPYVTRDLAQVAERQREKEIARGRAARLLAESPEVRAHVERCVRRLNGTPGDPASFATLHDLLERQAYRLAYWRTAFDEINYRRFFDVNELAGLRTEHASVFEDTHALVGSLVARGVVRGLRVDHPDGLFDPRGYFERLRELVRRQAADSPLAATEPPCYLLAEKILTHGESLPGDWPVAGTTGYGFLATLNALFVDPGGLTTLARSWTRITGERRSFAELAYDCKRLIMLTSLASELNVLAHAMNRLSEASWRTRDFNLNSCRRALLEVVACLPVYRTYVTEAGASDADRAAIGAALAAARRRNPAMEPTIFDFLSRLLLPSAAAPDEVGGPSAQDRLAFAMKLQQYTGPVHAKGVEDTAFYRYNVLTSLNEV
ncbi:MAG: malto-oligosyltrehalose synthase, partial [Vicinamibacterales bacterium]|nr:malto-oligosyltrehalose synthase [Vicinamibacterales bacterium]